MKELTLEDKARSREQKTAFWRELLEAWDWMPVVERVKADGKFKMGARRWLMASTEETWVQALSAANTWVEEYCFDQAMRQVLSDRGLCLEIDNHVFWVKGQ